MMKNKKLKKLEDIKEEEAWSDWEYSSTIWNFNVGKNAKEGVHGIEDLESIKYHTDKNPNKLYSNTAFAGKLVPHLVRKLIHKYSKKGDIILDTFCGSGTIPVEAKINDRKWIGLDVNPLCVKLTRRKLQAIDKILTPSDDDYNIYEKSATDISFIKDESIDLILTHPPYWGLIDFTELIEDIGNQSLLDYLKSMKNIMTEYYRVLKPDSYFIIVIGDARKVGIVPLSSYLQQIGLKIGFNLWDLLIYDTRFGGKQINRFRMIRSQQKKFHLTSHDEILIFCKRKKGWKYVDMDDIFKDQE